MSSKISPCQVCYLQVIVQTYKGALVYAFKTITKFSLHWIIVGSGKKAFIQADGIKTLYTLSLETLECKLIG